MNQRLLIVDDETNMRWVLKEALAEVGYTVRTAGSGQEALADMAESPADLVLLDLKMKGMDGLATLQRLRERWPDVVILILTAYGTVATAVEAMQLGAADYLRKPFDVEEIRFKIHRALERQAMQAELQRLREAARPATVDAPAGTHPLWQHCVEQMRSLTRLDLGILLLGEPGTGRTMLARFAHGLSRRSAAPLVECDLRGLPAELQPTLLLGQDGSEGLWSRAGAGTLLARNVECMSQEAWALLGERVRRGDEQAPWLLLTSTAPPPAVTALPLAQVEVPALRDRRDDIALLARLFAPGAEITTTALALLEAYTWPGNTTELRGVVERAAMLAADGRIDERHLPERVRLAPMPGTPIRLPLEGLRLEDVEIALIRQALERAGGNKTRAADLLGLTRQTLLYRCEKYGLTP